MGAIAATLVKQKNPFWLGITSHLKYILPIIFFLIGLYWIGLNFIPVDYFFYSICFAFILSFIAVTKGQVTNIVLRFAEKMGKMTYGIYLWHFITILIAFTLLNYFFAEADRNSIAANTFLYFTSFALTYVVAFLSYRFFELPFLKLKRKFKV
jgi:peptidoglycan/LPS O-acetylase OafA/YrhL